MISTESQAKYLACRLTRQSRFGEMEKLIPVYLKSGIEVYPHQIAAAYFAVSNPFSKGFILCDEVGLGKANHRSRSMPRSYPYVGNDTAEDECVRIHGISERKKQLDDIPKMG